MAENPILNGLDEVPVIKSEPVDPLLDPIDPNIIPKEFLATNGIHEDSDCEDIAFFTQVEVDNTRKCLENTRLIIKDFETQLDWHLQQYMTLRNIFNPKKSSKNGKEDGTAKRQDLLSISQLSAIISNHPEGNKKFIKRKGPISNGAGGRRRRKVKDSESEDSDVSEEDSEEYDEEDFEEPESEDVDDPGKKKKKGGRKKVDKSVVKDEIEIEEEVHELIEPKVEKESDEEMYEVKKTPAKRGRKPKVVEESKTPAKRGRRSQKGMETVDLTNLKTCKVVLDRLQDSPVMEIKDEGIDRDELISMLQSKAIESLDDFVIDPEKPIAILKEDNVKEFDFDECKSSNVVLTYETKESLPEYVFIKDVANHILNGMIKFVHGLVFDQYLSGQKN